jgi:DNA-binding PadR family transcriptional regulator
MGVLQYAILGLLNRKDMTGYDLSKEFQTELSEFWSAKHSQIYPELKSLSENHLVEFKTEITGNVLEKKLYSITESGRKELIKWEKSYTKLKALPKDEFKLQLFFSDCISTGERIELLKNQLDQHHEKLVHLNQNMGKFDLVPPASESSFSDYLVLLGAIHREEAACNWLNTCISLCESRK